MDDLVTSLSEQHQVSKELVDRMILYEKTKVHMDKRRGAKDELRRIIEKHLNESTK